MKTEILSIEDILNSEFMNEIIEKEDKDLAEAGWNYEMVKNMAEFISKNK